MIEYQPTHSRSAWSISVLFHCCLLLAAALCATSIPAGLPPQETTRPASIVLRQVHEHKVEYFEEPQAELASGSESLEPADAADPSAANPLTNALPDEAESVPLAALPKSEELGPLPDALDVTIAPVERRSGQAIASGDDQAVIDADLQRQQQRAAGRPSGPPAEVSLFGSKAATGHRFAFVIDRSKSMGGEGLGVLEAADGQFAAALERLRENHSFQIIAYNDHLDRYPKKGLAAASGQSKQQALAFVRGLAAFRGTKHGLALLAAAHTEADVIFLLTDGGDPEPAAYEMREVLKECAGGKTVHALQFGFGPPRYQAVFMQTLAQRTGGSYQYVDVSAW